MFRTDLNISQLHYTSLLLTQLLNISLFSVEDGLQPYSTNKNIFGVCGDYYTAQLLRISLLSVGDGL